MTMPTPSSGGDAPLTLMAVHAHPDDEVVFAGGLWPLYHDRGVRTVLVTCTGGEQGEIHDPDLDPVADAPRLGTIRSGELRCAVAQLKIDVLERLGYEDSGMADTEPNSNTACFHQAPRAEATRRLVALVRRYQPQVLITYNDFGAYGHPDHIAAHQITMAAFDCAGDPAYGPDLGAPWQPLKLYYVAWAEEGFKQAREMYLARGLKWPWDHEEDTDAEAAPTQEAETAEPKPPPYEPPPVTTRVDVRAYVPRRLAAARCHRTQFSQDGLFWSIPDDIALVAMGEDALSLVHSRVRVTTPESDIFAGII